MSLSQTAFASPAAMASTALPVAACDGGRRANRENEAASDAALMARIVAGDQAAFDGFAQRHVASCLVVAQRILGNHSDAEEVVQDALLRVWLHAPEWRQEAARVTTWLYRIVVNLALDHMRRNRRRLLPLDDAGDPADPAPDAQTMAESREVESFIARVIAELPTRQRIALTLCCVEQLECAEAAQIMRISVSALESLLVRGRRTLRGRLDRLAAAGQRAESPTRRHEWRRGRTSLDLAIGSFAGAPA